MSYVLPARALHELHPFPWHAKEGLTNGIVRYYVVVDARGAPVCEAFDEQAADTIASVMNEAAAPPVPAVFKVAPR